MPSYLDLGVIGVILVSASLAMVRGFTREVLAIVSWAAAAAAAYYFYPLVLPYVKPYIPKDAVAMGVSAGIVFFVALVVVSIITVRISDAILDSKVGALDRSLGFVFGAARGLLLCAVAFVFFKWLVVDQAQPEWVKNAKLKPLLDVTGEKVLAMLPDDPDGVLAKLKKSKTAAPNEEQPADDEQKPPTPAPRPAAPAPQPAPQPAPKKPEAARPNGAVAPAAR